MQTMTEQNVVVSALIERELSSWPLAEYCRARQRRGAARRRVSFSGLALDRCDCVSRG